MPCHELGWKESCALSWVTNLGTWAYTAIWERLLKAHDHLIITLIFLISPDWIPKSCVDIWPQQAPGGIASKEKGVDGVSTQLGNDRASVSSHSTLQLQVQPCDWSEHLGVTSQRQVTSAGYRAQTTEQISDVFWWPDSSLHDLPRQMQRIGPTQLSRLSGAGDKKQAEKDERWEEGKGQR